MSGDPDGHAVGATTQKEIDAMFDKVRTFVASKSPEEVSEIKRILAKYENSYATISNRIFYLDSDITTFESQLSQWFYEKPYAEQVYTTTVEKPGLLANNMFRQRAAITQRLATAYAEIDPLRKDMKIFDRFYNGYTTSFNNTTNKQRFRAIDRPVYQDAFFEYIVSQPNNVETQPNNVESPSNNVESQSNNVESPSNNVESPSNSGESQPNSGGKKSKNGKKTMKSKKGKKHMNSKKGKKSMRRK